jgi:hypothetical protein
MTMSDEERDVRFKNALVMLVTEYPELELDQLCANLEMLGFARPYVNSHLMAITAAMNRAHAGLAS